MRYFEFMGAAMAALGFGLLSTGFLFTGFQVGLLSCLVLIPYFVYRNQYSLLGLQFFFMCANILGMVNNWGTM